MPFDQAKFVDLFKSTYDQLEPGQRPAYFAFLALMAYKAFVEENVRTNFFIVTISQTSSKKYKLLFRHGSVWELNRKELDFLHDKIPNLHMRF